MDSAGISLPRVYSCWHVHCLIMAVRVCFQRGIQYALEDGHRFRVGVHVVIREWPSFVVVLHWHWVCVLLQIVKCCIGIGCAWCISLYALEDGQKNVY